MLKNEVFWAITKISKKRQKMVKMKKNQKNVFFGPFFDIIKNNKN